METAVIEFLFSALAQLAAQYPDAAWLAVALSAVMTVCGLCAVATVWMPVPKGTAGPYAAVYRWAHAFAAHFGQNRGGGGRQIRNRAGRSQSRDGEVMRGPSYPQAALRAARPAAGGNPGVGACPPWGG